MRLSFIPGITKVYLGGVEITEWVERNTDIHLSPWQRDMLRLRLDNRSGRLEPAKPKPRVRIRTGGRWRGPYPVVFWDELTRLEAPARARRSRMRAAYRARHR